MNKKRNPSLDILRVIATIAVVVFHVMGSSANNDPLVSPELHAVITAITNSLEWHVPVFFMITGYLWLSNEKKCTFPKMLPNIRRFLLVLCTFGFSYAMMERFFTDRVISFDLVKSSAWDVMTGNLWDHMWFMYAIIGVYLFLPIIKPFFESSSNKAISTLVGLLFLFTILSPVLEDFVGYMLPIQFPLSSPAFYICAGGLVARLNISAKKTSLAAAGLFFSSSVAVFGIQLFCPAYATWNTLFTCVSAVSIMIMVTTFFSATAEARWIHTISECSFGIYLLHPFFINLMLKVLHIYPLQHPPLVSLFVTSCIIIGLSYLTTYLLRKIRNRQI